MHSIILLLLLSLCLSVRGTDVKTGEYIVEVRGSCDGDCRSKVAESVSAATASDCQVLGAGSVIVRLTFLTVTCNLYGVQSVGGVSVLEEMPQHLQEVNVVSPVVDIVAVAPNIRETIDTYMVIPKDGDKIKEMEGVSRQLDIDNLHKHPVAKQFEKFPAVMQKQFRGTFPQLFPSVTPSTTPSPSVTPTVTPTSSPTPSSSSSSSPTPTKSSDPTPTPTKTPSKSPSPTPFRNRVASIPESPSPSATPAVITVTSETFNVPTDGGETESDYEIPETNDDGTQAQPVEVGDDIVLDTFELDGDFSGDVAPTGRQLFLEKVFNKPVARQSLFPPAIIFLCNGVELRLSRVSLRCSGNGSLLPLLIPKRITVKARITNRNGKPGLNIKYRFDGLYGGRCVLRFRYRIVRPVLPSPSPSPSALLPPAESPSSSVSPIVDPTPTSTSSMDPSVSATVSPSTSTDPSATPSSSIAASVSPTASISASPSVSTSVTPIVSPLASPSQSARVTPSASLSVTATASISVTPSTTVSATASETASISPSESPNLSATASISASPTSAESASLTPTASISASATASNSATATATISVTPSTTVSATASETASISPSESPSMTASISATPSISVSTSMSPSGSVTPTPLQTIAPLWHIDQVDGTYDGTRTCTSSLDGQGIHVVVIDTGCVPYRGGFCWGANRFGNSCADGHNHGTHVAGTVGSANYGVATSAMISCYKSLSDEGGGYKSDSIAGIAYAVQQGAHVINLSLGGSTYKPQDDAVEAAASNGMYFAISSGNKHEDACTQSPARASGDRIFTVQAHDSTGTIAYFSNWGTCTDITAPGVGIRSYLADGNTALWQGTSMAAPHVAGAIARKLSDQQVVSKSTMAENYSPISDLTEPTAMLIPRLGPNC